MDSLREDPVGRIKAIKEKDFIKAIKEKDYDMAALKKTVIFPLDVHCPTDKYDS